MRHSHPDPAAARGSLDHQRVADLAGGRERCRDVVDRLAGAGRYRHAGIGHEVAGADLVAHRDDRLRRRPHPAEPGVEDGLGELRALGEEAVAGVDRLGAGEPGRLDQLVDDEVGLRGRRRAEQDGLIGLADVRQGRIRLGMHSNRA